MRRVCLALALLLAACSSSDYDRPQDQPRGAYGRGGGQMRGSGANALLDILPDDAWWREPSMAAPLNLTNDQFMQLDRIATDNRDEIARLQRDLPVAMRDLRAALDADPASRADINSAAQRVRDLRSSIFDRQLQMASAERLVLTKQQWAMLEDELQRQRDQRGNDGYPGGFGRGRRGGYPRGGVGRPWP